MSTYKGREYRPDQEFVWNIGVISSQAVNQKRDVLADLVSSGGSLDEQERLEADIQIIEETVGKLIGRQGLVQLPPYIQNLDEKPQASGDEVIGFSNDISYQIDGSLATIREWK